MAVSVLSSNVRRIGIILRYLDMKVKSFFRFRFYSANVAKFILDLDIMHIFVYS
jgi:hypothetical protein